LIHHSPVGDPFFAGRAWRLYYKLDLELMRREAADLLGRHDFAAFRGAADARTTTERTLTDVTVETLASGLGGPTIAISVTGDRFLYNMVRIIVGTLVDVGRGQLPPGTVRRGLDSKQRDALGMTAPPDGLCLEHVELGEIGSGAWPV
jgi:tRNA pseudouridine38-40 synthase